MIALEIFFYLLSAVLHGIQQVALFSLYGGMVGTLGMMGLSFWQEYKRV